MMDGTRMILAAVARADMWLCRVLTLPWCRIVLSLLIAALTIHVFKAVRHE